MDLQGLLENLVQKDQLDQKATLVKQGNPVNLVLEEKEVKLVIVDLQELLGKMGLMGLRENQEA